MIELGHLLSRRQLMRHLATGIAAVAGIASALPAHASELTWTRNKPKQIFVLDPYSGPPGATCWKCSACRNHAEHKRFATFAAADQNRAHPNCRCGISSMSVSEAEYHTLFSPLGGKEIQSEAIDLRAPRFSKLKARNSLLVTRLSSL